MQLTPIKSFGCESVCVSVMCACERKCVCKYVDVYALMMGQLQQHKGAFWKQESTAINQSDLQMVWHEKRAWPLLTPGVSPNLLCLPTQEWLSVCVETQREGWWWRVQVRQWRVRGGSLRFLDQVNYGTKTGLQVVWERTSSWNPFANNFPHWSGSSHTLLLPNRTQMRNDYSTLGRSH